jgi:hypothetical protein
MMGGPHPSVQTILGTSPLEIFLRVRIRARRPNDRPYGRLPKTFCPIRSPAKPSLPLRAMVAITTLSHF